MRACGIPTTTGCRTGGSALTSLSPYHANAGGDPDRDRLVNLREYRQHTNPRREDTDRDGVD